MPEFVCSCGSKFATKSTLDRHEARKKHGKVESEVKCIKNYPCNYCKSTFKYKRGLYEHLRKKHKEYPDQLPKLKKRTPKKGTETCLIPQSSLESVQKLIPDDWDFQLTSCTTGNEVCFTIIIEIDNVNEADLFLEEYCIKNNVRYRLTSGGTKSKNILLKKKLKCHRNTQKKSEVNRKNTDCRAGATITVTKDKTSERYSLKFACDLSHNHSLPDGEAGKILPPDFQTRELFRRLFEDGLSPRKAIKTHEKNLPSIQATEPSSKKTNRFHCPKRWVYHYYYNCFKKDCDGTDDSLLSVIEKYNEQCGEECAKMLKDDDGFAVVMVTPLMKRVTCTNLARDIYFVGNSGSMDRNDCRVILMLAISCAGSLPVGIIITNNKSEKIITAALELHLSMLGATSFGNRNKLGPKTFMSDCNDAERSALHSVYPHSAMYFCLFHVLQAVWRYLTDPENKIDVTDRQHVYCIVERFVHAETEDSYAEILLQSQTDEILNKYPQFVEYFNNEWLAKSSEWALFEEEEKTFRDRKANDICEGAMRILKDQIFDLSNPVQLFEFLSQDFNHFYEKKLMRIASNRVENFATKSNRELNLDDFSVVKCNAVLYEIFSKIYKYSLLVNTELCLCTCPYGRKGFGCRHFRTVLNLYEGASHVLQLPNAKEEKPLFHYLATGSNYDESSEMSVGWTQIVDEYIVEEDDDMVQTQEIEQNWAVRHLEDVYVVEDAPMVDAQNTEQGEPERKEFVMQELRRVCDDMMKRVEDGFEECKEGVLAFCRNYENLGTKSGFVSQLPWCWRYPGLGPPR